MKRDYIQPKTDLLSCTMHGTICAGSGTTSMSISTTPISTPGMIGD